MSSSPDQQPRPTAHLSPSNAAPPARPPRPRSFRSKNKPVVKKREGRDSQDSPETGRKEALPDKQHDVKEGDEEVEREVDLSSVTTPNKPVRKAVKRMSSVPVDERLDESPMSPYSSKTLPKKLQAPFSPSASRAENPQVIEQQYQKAKSLLKTVSLLLDQL